MRQVPEQDIVTVGLLGAGYMGRNHARVLASMPGVRLVGVYDEAYEEVGEFCRGQGLEFFRDPDELMAACRSVVVALPTALHFDFASRAMKAGLDVLVEKPIASSVEEGRTLAALAGDEGRVLQVGHVERFNPVCLELPRLVDDPIYISCERLSPFMPTWVGKTGVTLDLMIHDLDLVLSLVGDEVASVQAVARSVESESEDIASALVRFEGGTLAGFTASRVSQAKVRTLSVTQPDLFIAADLLRQTISLHHLISNDFVYDERMGYKQVSVTEIPYLSRYGEPLRLELESFLESVRDRSEPQVSADDGVRALELAGKVMESAGIP
ncbi:MAG: Gfo/Idh/MocA family oxidoreductase [Actinomycetota bacterium]